VDEITDILKNIVLFAVLKERFMNKKTETAILKAEIVALKTENIKLKTELQRIKGDKTIIDYICPFCHTLTGKLLEEGDAHPLRQFNQIKRIFECEKCGKEYPKQYQRQY
jgi:uncharacterized protein with PIN domain